MVESPKSYNNGSSATKLLSLMIWRTLNDYPMGIVIYQQEYGASVWRG